MRSRESDAMLTAVCDSPGDTLARLALADALRDCGCPESIALEARGPLPFGWWTNHAIDFGIGIGRGIGIGSGSGSGSGIGSGIGIGIGSGIGRGRGSGSGSGIGRGSGSGSGIGSGRGTNQMEQGKAYLVHCGDWHTICGRVVRQAGPFTYLMECVSKIAETNAGDNWHALAAGDQAARKKATYQHYTTTAVVPLNVLAFVWVGELPQEWK